MNFTEWCDHIARDTDSNVSRELVKEIMGSAIKVAIEEILSNKADASLDLLGVGKFYLNRVRTRSPIVKKRCNVEEGDYYYWQVNFKASNMLKDLFNDRRDFQSYLQNRNKYIVDSKGEVKRKEKRRRTKVEIKTKVKKEFKKSLKKEINAKLPED